MRIVVIAPHPDDYLYGTGGTLMTHQEDDRHLVVVAPIQRAPMIEVASELGVTLHVLDGQYRNIDSNVSDLQPRITKILEELMPDYVLAPCDVGDWSSDHTTTGRMALRGFVDSGAYGQWNGRLLRYPIPGSTTSFTPNVWVQLDPSLLERKLALSTRMVRGAEDVWPHEVVEWEIATGHRFAQEVGWPARHVEAFDALYRIPFARLPPRDASTAHLAAQHRTMVSGLIRGSDPADAS